MQATAQQVPQRLSLPFAAESVGTARRAITDWLTDWLNGLADRGDFVDDCRLVLSELVGNSVRHAVPLADQTLAVTWRMGADEPTVVITVTDGGAEGLPRVRAPGVEDESGRGLAIVQALSRCWWVERSAGEISTHAVVSADSQPRQVVFH